MGKQQQMTGLGGLSESATEGEIESFPVTRLDTYFDFSAQCTTKLDSPLEETAGCSVGGDYGTKITCSVGDLPGI